MKSTQESAERCGEGQPIDGHVGIGERHAREWEIVGKGGETLVFSFGEARDFLALRDPENQVVANVGDNRRLRREVGVRRCGRSGLRGVADQRGS